MAVRATNTMAEELQRLLATIAQMKVLPDADPGFIAQLEEMIVGKLREPIDAMQAAGISTAGGQPQLVAPPGGMGGMGGAMPPGVPSPQMTSGPPPAGMSMGYPLTAPDELRRMLAGA